MLDVFEEFGVVALDEVGVFGGDVECCLAALVVEQNIYCNAAVVKKREMKCVMTEDEFFFGHGGWFVFCPSNDGWAGFINC